MKMKKLMTSAFMAMAALAAPVAALAGDIVEIKPYLDTRETPDDQLVAGQSFTFLVRLASRSQETDEISAWNLTPTFNPSGWDPEKWSEFMRQLNPPKMGIVVSGKLRDAEYVTSMPQKDGRFTDLIFEYKVQAGDFAQPVYLALKGSTETKPIIPGMETAGSEQTYFVRNVKGIDPASEAFEFRDSFNQVAEFSYRADESDIYYSYWPDPNSPVHDTDFTKAHYCVRSIDFDDRLEEDAEDGKTYWRVVSAGATQTRLTAPTVVTLGLYDTNAAPTASTKLYVWSDDESAVTLEKAKGARQLPLYVPNPDGSKPAATVLKWVYSFDLVTGTRDYSFDVYGNPAGEGKTANLILSGSAGYLYDSTSQVVTNFLVSPLAVKCGKKPAPSVKVTWETSGAGGIYPGTGLPPETVTAFTDKIDEIYDKGYKLSVKLSEKFGVATTLRLKALIGDSTDEKFVYTNALVGTAVGDPGVTPDSFTTPPSDVEIAFGPDDLEKKVWIYPVGGSADTKSKGVTFTVEYKEAEHPAHDIAKAGFGTLKIADPKPVVVQPTAEDVYSFSNKRCEIPVIVRDCYRDLSAPRTFTVEISSSTEGTLCTSNLVAFTAPDEAVKIVLDEAVLGRIQGDEAKEVKAQVKVTDALNSPQTSATFILQVPAKEKAKTVTAELYDTTAESSKHEGIAFSEGAEPVVRFVLSESLEVGRDLYAFLVAQNEASSNLVATSMFKQGVLIPGGETVSGLSAKLSLLDGTAMTDGESGQLKFKIVLRTDADLTKGEVDKTFVDTKGLTINVMNVNAAAATDGLFVNGSPEATPNGGKLDGEIASGVDQTFVASFSDVSRVDLTNGIRVVWCFTDGRPRYAVVTGTTDTVECKYKFSTVGADQKVMFVPVDKDLLASLTTETELTESVLKTLWPSITKIVSPYTITVRVGDAPHVVITPETSTFFENSTTNKVRFALSEPYGAKVYLRVRVTPLNDYSTNPGCADFVGSTSFKPAIGPRYSQVVLEIAANALEPAKSTSYNQGLKFDYAMLDGTRDSGSEGDGFYVEAKAFSDPACATPLTDYADGTGYVYVDNVPPTIITQEPQGVTNELVSGQETSVSWHVNDPSLANWRDVTNDTGLVCKWYVAGALKADLGETIKTNMTGDITTKFTLSKDGVNTVKLVVTDKDGGSSEAVWYYYIEPTKRLELRANGPSQSSGQPKYKPSGIGRVWADGIQATAEDFKQTWTYGVRDTEATVYAWGYAAATDAPYFDDGSLGGKRRDVALKPDGSDWGSATPVKEQCYKIDGAYDNFFYCWARIGGEKGGTAVTYDDPVPAYSPTAESTTTVTLDEFAENKASYTKRSIEAIFSRELFTSDNLGDVNLDGFPDVVEKWFENDGGGAFGASDTQDKAELNDDGDFLPNIDAAYYAGIVAGLPEDWAENSVEFTARLELRGWYNPAAGDRGDFLNDALDLTLADGTANKCYRDSKASGKTTRIYEDPDVNTNSTLSKVEWLAYQRFLEKGGTPMAWTPERPTDPRTDDTDKDGFSDGYEYYFWYKAHVGWLDANTNLVQLVGHRYNPADPLNPEIITSEEIARVMDPLVKSSSSVETTDTDNDGIPDLMEVRNTHTNPFEFDTDGDGLPDGYEVLVGLDPCRSSTDGAVPDGERNLDQDTMAEAKLEKKNLWSLVDDKGHTNWFWSVDNSIPGTVTTNTVELSAAATWFKVGETEYATTNDFPYAAGESLGEDFGPAGVWTCKTNSVGNLVIVEDGTEVILTAGTVLDEVRPNSQVFREEENVTKSDHFFGVLEYGPVGKFVRTREYAGDDPAKNALTNLAAGATLSATNLYVIHCDVYQELGFDPRTGWGLFDECVNTRAYTQHDEFMLMAWLMAQGCKMDVTPTRVRPWNTIWGAYCTGDSSPDCDGDGAPDGWELYVMSGPRKYDDKTKARIITFGFDDKTFLSPLRADAGDPKIEQTMDGSLPPVDEFCGLRSCEWYATYAPACETILNRNPGWTNKAWPTDPWNADTDGDGLGDAEEMSAGGFLYGDATEPGAGGGLNPLSWDTDGDGLPDPWEVEFAGTFVPGDATTKTETKVDEKTGETNTVTTVIRAAGGWEGGMDGTVNDATEDYDFDGLMNWQEYLAGMMRCWRYDDPFSSWLSHEFDPFTEPPDPIYDHDAWNQYWFDRLVCEPDHSFYTGATGGWGVHTQDADLEGHHDYNPNLIAGVFDFGSSYLSCCTNAWDAANGKWYYFKDGVYHDLANPGIEWCDDPKADPKFRVQYNRFTYWVALRDNPLLPFMFDYGQGGMQKVLCYPTKYICCDPRKWDTDDDGMDDYYELFHGMNPLLGESGVAVSGNVPTPRDIIFEAYMGSVPGDPWSAEDNFWYNAFNPQNDSDCGAHLVRPAESSWMSTYDFIAYPWLTGLAGADPDGDGIRNQEEAILPSLQAPATWLHTDPTPLWLTDLAYPESLTFRYYRQVAREPGFAYVKYPLEYLPAYFEYDANGDGTIDVETERWYFNDFPGYEWTEEKDAATLHVKAYTPERFWLDSLDEIWQSFEENEGYDSDHDYLSDLEETQGRTKSASDPQDFDSPNRRQAMHFDGVNSFLETPLETAEMTPDGFVYLYRELPFLYYTVECWVKPEDVSNRRQTVVERAIYNGPAGLGDQNYMRKNFQIGIKDGQWYTKFDSAGTGVRDVAEVSAGTKAEAGVWTHVAATYDGEMLRLFVNGACKASKRIGFHPEYGASSVNIEVDKAKDDYRFLSGRNDYPMRAILVGASAMDDHGLVFDYTFRINPMDTTTLADYGEFFKGWVDEVRLWDGARTEAQISADYRKRFTREDCIALREKAFADLYPNGASFEPASPAEREPELRYHFTFDHLPGAHEQKWAQAVPAGFDLSLKKDDARALYSRPWGWFDPWLYSIDTSILSKVYTDLAWRPWIANTMAHLPRFDQTTTDSIYWSADYAGNLSASSLGAKQIDFPRTAEPYSKWVQGPASMSRLNVAGAGERYIFTLRNSLTEGADLMPFGNAYPQRDADGMWDERGPMDAWAETGKDGDADGLPDWWVAYAKMKYLKDPFVKDFGWDSTVWYPDSETGAEMKAWQAYLRDLAKGMLPDKKYHPEYASTVDLNGNNIPDWWEEYWSLTQSAGGADPDHDGLSNEQEYRISEKDDEGFGPTNGYPLLNPLRGQSLDGQDVPDYFLRSTAEPYVGWYFGEIVGDFDMMEDDNEDKMGTLRTKYDAYSDNDEDGWTAWSEMRYSTYKMSRVARLVSHMVGTEEITDSPTPVIHATLRYNGGQDGAAGAPIVIQAFAGNNLSKRPMATYTVRPGESVTNSVILGAWEKRVVHGTLTPGHIQAGFNMVTIEGAFVQANDLFSWKVGDKSFEGTYRELQQALALEPGLTVNAEEFKWNVIVNPAKNDCNIIQLSVDEQTQTGYFLVDDVRAGEVNLLTGDFTLDLSKLTGFMGDSGINLNQYVYRLGCYSRIPTLQTKALTVSLAGADTGAIREGTASFVAFMDLDGSGDFTPGEPIGFARDVEIGWDNVPELAIELTDESPAAGKRFAYGAGVETLRVIRVMVNGSEFVDEAGLVPVKRRIVYSRDAKSSDRKYVFEGDLVTAGKLGLDWANLRSDLLTSGLQLKDVTEVTYWVVKNAVSVDHIDGADIIDTFTVSFPAQQTKPTAVSPSEKSDGIVTSQRPTFVWSGTEENTAFAVVIRDAAGAEVWSNTNAPALLPPRNAAGNYVWTAPVYIGSDVCDDAWLLENGSNYTWEVAMFNAKFSKIEDAVWSDKATFRTALAAKNDFKTAYGTAKVLVRYFGPATNALSNVVVRLYRNADFTGEPAAQARLSDVAGDVQALADGAREITFLGLASGDYYAVAFIDRNGNVKRDRWETWGYANQIGLSVQAIYSPAALEVDAANAKVPSVTVYMEDTDVNQDKLPDCLTADESVLAAASAAAAAEDGSKDDDGDGLTVDQEASDTYTDPMKWDTDGDLMPDGWEASFAEIDPLFADGETVDPNDVMAYAEVKRQLVTDASGKYYLVNPTNRTIRVGDTLRRSQLVDTYDYAGKYGVGTNLADGAAFKVDKVAEVVAVLVHAQVFDEFGFDPTTALVTQPNADGVIEQVAANTKPFTALDKYLLVRYLEAQGLADEKVMNLNQTPGRQWKDFTLKPLDPDNDRDGIADGWELYVMFGTNGVGNVTNGVGEVVRATSLAQAKISPWNPNDARDDALDLDGDGLNVLGEYNGGKAPMNPWDAHTLTDTFDDLVAFAYNIASAETQLADDDNDGLSNWAEYLASEVYGFGAFAYDDAYSATGDVLDYFVVVTNGEFKGWYVGEVVADHDFMDDVWEDLYDVDVINRYVFDGALDGDGDGWSNWSEARAGTDPTSYGRLSLVRADGAENNVIDEFPIPRIHMKLSYDSDRPFVSPIVVKAWSGNSVNGAADAVWHVAGAAEETAEGEKADVGLQSRFIGLNPLKEIHLNIGPGAIAEGHVKLDFYDPRYSIEHLTVTTNDDYDVVYNGKKCSHTYTYHTIDSSNWAGGNWWPDFPADKRFGQTTGVIKHGSEEMAESGNYADATYEVVGSVDYKTGDVKIDFTSPSLSKTEFTSTSPTGEGTYDRHHYNLVRSYWRISWVSRLVSGGKVKEFTLQKPDNLSAESFGHLAEGLNTFIAFADDNGNGEWDAGEPFGLVRNVDIGWDRANVAIELTDDSAAFKRLAVADYPEWVDTNAVADVTGETGGAVTTAVRRVRIMRTSVNEQPLAKPRMVFSKLVDLGVRNWLAENDFIKSGRWDFDDRYLVSDALAANIAGSDIRTAEYEIYVGDGSVSEMEPADTWQKEFTVNRVAPTVVSPSVNSYYRLLTAQPTLCWKGPDGYTAFVIQIATNQTFTGDILYSVTNFLPAATEAGYSYKAPVYVGKELVDKQVYWWRVCELNAKFTDPGDWSEPASFRADVDTTNADTGYGRLAAEVRYYGPATNTQSQVVVGVYESADFTGDPVAKMVLGTAANGNADKGITNLAYRAAKGTDWMKATANVKFDGIAPGTYYVMAFVDRNANGVRDAFETWGYADGFGLLQAGAFYESAGIKVTSAKGDLPSVLVFMEDTDCNQNGTPDCLESASLFASRGSTTVDGLDSDRDGLPDFDETEDVGTEIYIWDTDKDDMPDGWEARFAETDPLNPDAEFAAEGDVMAYAVSNMTAITLWDGSDVKSATNTYVLAKGAADNVKVGDSAAGLPLFTTYPYGEKLGLGGSNTVDVSALKVYTAGRDTEVVLVHAQVYDYFGYNPLTANPTAFAAGTAVNTKEFTALDKYLLVRYLQGYGMADEVEMNTNRTWSAKTLRPNDADNDKDGLPDGWELYVMFGTNDVRSAATAKFSPWEYTDARDMALDFDGDGLTALDEYWRGGIATDPWNAYSVYEQLLAEGLLAEGTTNFNDSVARDFGIASGDLDDDDDLDLLTNLEELQGYYLDPVGLADIDPQNAWSNGVTNDYFRTVVVGGVKTYLGRLFNGGEFIEPKMRADLDMEDLVGAGTRDYEQTGWDYWSTARYSPLATGTNVIEVVTNGTEIATLTNHVVTVTNVSTKVELSLKYAGNASQHVFVEAYQTSSAYPERGEQLSAKWSATADFRAGLAKLTLDESNQTEGALVQGPARFVAYIDLDGDFAFSPADTYGTAKANVGYLGCDLTVRLGEANKALPAFALGNGEEPVSQMKIVRTHVNGQALINPHTVYKRVYANNVQRATVFPDDYEHHGDAIWEDGKKEATSVTYIGVDRGISKSKVSEDIDSVTYEILVGRGPWTVENLSEYGVLASNEVVEAGVRKWVYVTNTVQGVGGNITYTVNYSRIRDIADVTVQADQLADGEAVISFTVPKDTPATKFWLRLGKNNGSDDFGDAAGFLIPNLADGVAVIRLADYVTTQPLQSGIEYTVQVALGNDRFPSKPSAVAEWSKAATFVLGEKKALPGKLAVVVEHPTGGVTSNITVAVYEQADLANPVATKTGRKAGEVVEFTGLRENGGYYVAAWYVKDAADGRASAAVREPYDSWGYATMLGETETGFDAAELKAAKVTSVTNRVFLQDTDWNDNGLVDREEKLKAVCGIAEKGKGYIEYKDDFDLDGVPDAWEDVQEEEEEDEPTIVSEDVMAYYVCSNMNFVALGKDAEPTNWVWCAVFDIDAESRGVRLTDGTIKLQTPATAFTSLYSTYSYTYAVQSDRSKWNAVGTNVTYGAEWKVQATRTGRALFMHAQVYSLFGYNPKTAVPVADAVNTKAFTRNDKYLVCRYLQNVGVVGVDEELMGTNIVYQWLWTLKENTPDSDRDGIADGWELYTMFGPTGFRLPSGTDLPYGALTNAVENAILSPFDIADGQAPAPGAGSQLAAIEEYDNGYFPTDPWSVDTDGDGVLDYYAYAYRCKSAEDAESDYDGDGLSNYAEYLITEVFGLAACDPELARTNDGTVDAYKKVGDLYLGEIFSDHDQMEDWIEDELGGMSRYRYDADRDGDGNGWSNYAEVRARAAARMIEVPEIVKINGSVVTNYHEVSEYAFNGHPVPTLKLKLRFDSSRVGLELSNVVIVVRAYTDMSGHDALWLPTMTRGEFAKGEATLTLGTPASGYVREGLNTFTCSLGEEGYFAPGMLFGSVEGVDVGWSGTSFEIALTDVSPVFPRLDLYQGLDDRIVKFGAGYGGDGPGTNAVNDVVVPSLGKSDGGGSGGSSGSETAGGEHIRVVPYLVGGTLTDTAIYGQDRELKLLSNMVTNRVVAEFDVDPKVKYYLTEADILRDGQFDLDWDGFAREILNNANVRAWVGDVTSVKYRLVLGRDGLVGLIDNFDTETGVRAYETLIERRFEPTAKRTKPTQLVTEGVLYGARPTFGWRLDEPTSGTGLASSSAAYGCSYTAFQIQVRDKDNAVVYDSGVRRAPARKADGSFEWTAPVCVGDLTAKKKVFEPTGDWTWRVAMYNAKFKPSSREESNGWSANGSFSTMVCEQQEVNDKGYGSIAVAVRYAGSPEVLARCGDMTDLKGIVRVQAFASPDFTGDPLAATVVTDAAVIADTLDVSNTVRLVGLKMGGEYYVRAFVDSNGNGTKDAWESWGCVNYIGEQEAGIYAPKAVALDKSLVKAPVCALFIEDADTDQDWIPDAWEYAEAGWVGDWETVKDLKKASVDETIAIDTTVMSGTASFSTGLPGAPLTAFANGSFAAQLLGIDQTSYTFDDIRAAVDANVTPTTVKIVSMTLDATAREVVLTLDADVALSLAGQLVSQTYGIVPSGFATVTVKVFQKQSLVENWPTTPVKTFSNVKVGANQAYVTVPLGDDIDLASGFFKVVVE